MEKNSKGPFVLTSQQLTGIRRGLEKESLRVQEDGLLASTPHPAALGSALTPTSPRISVNPRWS